MVGEQGDRTIFKEETEMFDGQKSSKKLTVKGRIKGFSRKQESLWEKTVSGCQEA